MLNSDKDLVRTLAMNNLGSLYAEEIIKRANEFEEIDKHTPSADLSESQIANLNKAIHLLFDNLQERRTFQTANC